MTARVYEGLFLLDSNRYARDPGNVSKQIDKMVEDCGGEMLASRMWAEQKLAYEIAGHRKGTYWLTYFRLDSLKQKELNRACQLNENVLRNIVLKVDDRLVDALVQHASGAVSSETDESAGAEESNSTEAAAPANDETSAE